MYDDILEKIPTATRADLERLPPNSRYALERALLQGWQVSVSGFCWTLIHKPSGGYISASGDGLRYVGTADLKT